MTHLHSPIFHFHIVYGHFSQCILMQNKLYDKKRRFANECNVNNLVSSNIETVDGKTNKIIHTILMQRLQCKYATRFRSLKPTSQITENLHQGCHRNCKIKFQNFPGLFWVIFQDYLSWFFSQDLKFSFHYYSFMHLLFCTCD